MNRRKDYANDDKAKRTAKLQKRRYRQRTGSGMSPRRDWTEHEENAVLAHAIPDRELSEKIDRSVQAIQVRRCVLKGRQ